MSDNKETKQIVLTMSKLDNEISIKDIQANYCATEALTDIESLYGSDEFMTSIPDGDTQYLLTVEPESEELDINPCEEPVDIDMVAITRNIADKLYLCECYSDIIIWHGIFGIDCINVVEEYHKYDFLNEFMSLVGKTTLSSELATPFVNNLIDIPEDPTKLYDFFMSNLNELVDMYELYIFNYPTEIQGVIDTQLVILNDLKREGGNCDN